MKVLIAPDKFKDAVDATSAAEAIAAGVREADPNGQIDLCPLADGGEGTGPILACSIGAEARTSPCHDALARRTEAEWWFEPRSQHAVIEMARIAGLQSLAPSERDPERTTTYGVGAVIRTALQAGAATIDLTVGGSATVDGGAGCLQALGVEFSDAKGNRIAEPITGGSLHAIAGIDSLPRVSARIRVLCDVRNPLLGPRGAAPSFAPQKGASPKAARRLEAGLRHWRDLLLARTGIDVADIPHAGAAGGIGAGLHAAFGAELAAGFAAVAAAVRLPERVAASDLVLTGEGRLDAQTGEGKVVAGVAQIARRCGRPVVALVGSVQGAEKGAEALARRAGVDDIHVITPPATPTQQALRDTAENLRTAARRVVSSPRHP